MTMFSRPVRRWLAAIAGAAVFALLAGVPTAVIPNPVFSRMTPVQWWNYPILAVSAMLGGLVLATHVRTPTATATTGRTALPAQLRREPRIKPTKVVGVILLLLAVALVPTHLAEHDGTLDVLPGNLEDLFLGFPMAGALGIAAFIAFIWQ